MRFSTPSPPYLTDINIPIFITPYSLLSSSQSLCSVYQSLVRSHLSDKHIKFGDAGKLSFNPTTGDISSAQMDTILTEVAALKVENNDLKEQVQTDFPVLLAGFAKGYAVPLSTFHQCIAFLLYLFLNTSAAPQYPKQASEIDTILADVTALKEENKGLKDQVHDPRAFQIDVTSASDLALLKALLCPNYHARTHQCSFFFQIL